MKRDLDQRLDRQDLTRGAPQGRGSTGSGAWTDNSGKMALRPSHQRILEAFATYGPMAPDELAAHIGRSALYVRPRCSELRAMGLLRATGESRRNATSGLNAVVLVIAGAG